MACLTRASNRLRLLFHVPNDRQYPILLYAPYDHDDGYHYCDDGPYPHSSAHRDAEPDRNSSSFSHTHLHPYIDTWYYSHSYP